jgi:hypothetical protein
MFESATNRRVSAAETLRYGGMMRGKGAFSLLEMMMVAD